LREESQELAGSRAQFCEDKPKQSLRTPQPADSMHELSRIVADPATPESRWLAACVVAGDRSLVKTESWLQGLASAFLTLLSGIGIFLTAGLCYPAALFVCSNTLWFTSAIHPDVFLKAQGLTDSFGYLACLLTSISFLMCFLNSWKSGTRSLTCLSAIAIASLTAAMTLVWIGQVGATVLALLAGLGCIVLSFAGSALREALPKSLTTGKLVRATLSFLWLPAATMAYVLSQVASRPVATDSFGPASGSDLVFSFFFLAYCIVSASFAVTRASKAQSLKGCATLCIMLQSPLMLGLFLSATVSFCAAAGIQLGWLSPDINGNGTSTSVTTYALKGMSLIGITALLGAFAYFGALLGTKWNDKFNAQS